MSGEIQASSLPESHWADPDSWFWLHRNGCRSATSMFNCTNYNEVYSFHSGGAMFAFGDASVHFLSTELDPEVFVSLFTRSYGDIVTKSDF
jgi:prepilin-type processing-associated H-X9-DG protein